MQDRYVGDVGDYAKYALLRALTSASSGHLRLGVNWYMYPDEAHNGDGRHVSYLRNQIYSGLDPTLYRTLGSLVANGRRSVLAVRQSGALPSDTLHFAKPVPRRAPGCGSDATAGDRRAWALNATVALADADLVFLDPDNGIEIASLAPNSPKAGKYVLWEEIAGHWMRGQSLLVYHHLNRTKSVAAQVVELKAGFRERLGEIPQMSLPVFRRGSCRAFCVLGQREHAAKLRDREREFLSTKWSEHFLPDASGVP